MNNLNVFRNQSFQFAKIGAISDGTMVSFVNNFLYELVGQMNAFASHVETRLITLDRRIKTCQVNLVILEMKLNSVDGLVVADDDEDEMKEVVVADQDKTPTTIGEPQSIPPTKNDNDMPVMETIDEADKSAEPKTTAEVVETETADTVTEPPAEPAEEREDLIKFRKMLKFGIPPVAVRQKMIMEGVDPSLLNI